MKNLGISSIYATDKKNRLVGAVSALMAGDAVENGSSLYDALDRNVTTVLKETLLMECLNLFQRQQYQLLW